MCPSTHDSSRVFSRTSMRALAQLLDRVAAQVLADLGQDAAGRLDEHEPQVALGQLWVVARGVVRHVLDLGQRLDAGVAAADEDEGQQLRCARRVVGDGRRDVQLVEHLVAQRDRLLDLLEPDAQLGQAGDRQGARDRARTPAR